MRRIITLTLAALLWAAPLSADFKRPSWSDADRDGQNTRTEVLLASCEVTLDAKGRTVVTAVCIDPYTGSEIATDSPSQAVQIDHLLPASVAWERREWMTQEGTRCTRADRCWEFEGFFNDPQNLLATRARTNQRKSDRMPDRWCPADPVARMMAARLLLATAEKYLVPLQPKEIEGLEAWSRGSCLAGAMVP